MTGIGLFGRVFTGVLAVTMLIFCVAWLEILMKFPAAKGRIATALEILFAVLGITGSVAILIGAIVG